MIGCQVPVAIANVCESRDTLGQTNTSSVETMLAAWHILNGESTPLERHRTGYLDSSAMVFSLRIVHPWTSCQAPFKAVKLAGSFTHAPWALHHAPRANLNAAAAAAPCTVQRSTFV
jgi:hypothetical protein